MYTYDQIPNSGGTVPAMDQPLFGETRRRVSVVVDFEVDVVYSVLLYVYIRPIS